MEKLWSPWRSKYIDSFKSVDESEQCVFCQMVLNNPDEDNNLLVDSSQFTFTVLNLYPYNNGHLMIVPKSHKNDFSDLTEDELLEVMLKIGLAKNILSDVMKPQGFNIGANLGRVGGAGIEDHIHFHIVPRWSGDTNFMPVIGEVKIISQDLLETKHKLLSLYKEYADSKK